MIKKEIRLAKRLGSSNIFQIGNSNYWIFSVWNTLYYPTIRRGSIICYDSINLEANTSKFIEFER